MRIKKLTFGVHLWASVMTPDIDAKRSDVEIDEDKRSSEKIVKSRFLPCKKVVNMGKSQQVRDAITDKALAY